MLLLFWVATTDFNSPLLHLFNGLSGVEPPGIYLTGWRGPSRGHQRSALRPFFGSALRLFRHFQNSAPKFIFTPLLAPVHYHYSAPVCLKMSAPRSMRFHARRTALQSNLLKNTLGKKLINLKVSKRTSEIHRVIELNDLFFDFYVLLFVLILLLRKR